MELARKNWGEDEPRKETIKREILSESAPDLGDVWEVVHKNDPYEGMYDESGKDAYEGFYESEGSEKTEVKKAEIKPKRVPQKGRAVKRDRSKGAPDY